mgnify:CR=1 FL=1|jgi:TonB family protein
MRISILFLLTVILIFAYSVFAQDEDSEIPTCAQPFSTKFDEFEFTDLKSAKENLDLYGLQIKNQNAFGIVIGYGGRLTEANQGRSIAFQIETYLTEKFNFYKYVTISAKSGGHREKPFVELYIQPQRCSSAPDVSSSIPLDEVTFKEESDFFSKDISRKSIDEMEKLLISKVEPPFPAAARAVRAGGKVLLLVVVDEEGNVTNVRDIEGHPLLCAASETAVRKWKYQILKVNNKPVKFGGKVIIDFDEIARNLPKPVLDY